MIFVNNNKINMLDLIFVFFILGFNMYVDVDE